MNRCELEKIFIYFEKHISLTDLYLKDPELYTSCRDYFNDIILGVKGYVLGNHQKNIKFKMPATPWQLFKRKYFPQWFINKFPIKYVEFIIDAKLIYPYLKVNIPKDSGKFVLLFSAENPALDNGYWTNVS